jgi:hypothetical protein
VGAAWGAVEVIKVGNKEAMKGQAKSWLCLEQMTLESLDNLDNASMSGCLRQRCQVYADAARAAAGAAHGEGAEHEDRCIV